MTWREIVVIVTVKLFCFNGDDNGTILDFAELDTTIRTDLIILEHLNRKNKSYKFEDFFWTGSGDSPYEKDEEPWVIEQPTPVFHTTTATVTTTVYKGATDEKHHGVGKCIYNCSIHTTPDDKILPTPTLDDSSIPKESSDTNNLIDADREFWIITVFKTDGKAPEISDLKNSLVKLYKKAFQRQQARHLGIAYKRRKRKTPVDKPINVYIHHIDQKGQDEQGKKEVEILYHVAVSGKPVSATTAVADMSLVSDEEARQELGFPILIKAEPYIKPANPQSLIKAKNTWIIIGISIISLLIILLLIAFLSLGCKKRERLSPGIENRRQIFERSVDETDKGSAKTGSQIRKRGEHSPTYINFQNQPSAESIRSELSRKSAAYLTPSTSSSTSLDISPLMTVRKASPPKKPPRPKAALNRTIPINRVQIPQDLYDSDSNESRRNSGDNVFIDNYDPGVISPKSYLSMPSVKSFPRINNPEPLHKVLEPVSMLHLDMPDDVDIEIRHAPARLTRHGSVGTNADPGVIGPVVWDIHCQKLHHGVSVDEGIDDLNKTTRNMTRMRKRFNELLDDTFSLFGSRMDSPIENNKPSVIEVKSKSANVGTQRKTEDMQHNVKPRPRTSITKKIEQSTNKPRGAWTSSATSPLVRPLSAGVVAPRVNVEHIQAEGKFRESDPAIPLIAAIKSELQKCSLPGSATDLNK